MVRKKLIIHNPTGLHLRPAGLFCKTAMQFQSKITFLSKNTTANAKSVLSVLGACVKKGDEIELICEGEDEEKALQEMVRIVRRRIRRIRRRKNGESSIGNYGGWYGSGYGRRNKTVRTGWTKW